MKRSHFCPKAEIESLLGVYCGERADTDPSVDEVREVLNMLLDDSLFLGQDFSGDSGIMDYFRPLPFGLPGFSFFSFAEAEAEEKEKVCLPSLFYDRKNRDFSVSRTTFMGQRWRHTDKLFKSYISYVRAKHEISLKLTEVSQVIGDTLQPYFFDMVNTIETALA